LNHAPPFGYAKDDEGNYILNEEEAKWVMRLFEWYAIEVSIREIRKRFIHGGVKQRTRTESTSGMTILRRVLKADYYWTGNRRLTGTVIYTRSPHQRSSPRSLLKRYRNAE
jgi:hypothetical protein